MMIVIITRMKYRRNVVTYKELRTNRAQLKHTHTRTKGIYAIEDKIKQTNPPQGQTKNRSNI